VFAENKYTADFKNSPDSVVKIQYMSARWIAAYAGTG
jgi:hypothetical protein